MVTVASGGRVTGIRYDLIRVKGNGISNYIPIACDSGTIISVQAFDGYSAVSCDHVQVMTITKYPMLYDAQIHLVCSHQYLRWSPGSLRSGKALMRNEVHVRYSGKCDDNKDALKDAFVTSVQSLLRDEEMCPPEDQCTIADVQVMCGRRSRRDVSSYRHDRRETSRNATSANITSAKITTANIAGVAAPDDGNATATFGDVRIQFRIEAVVRNKTADLVTGVDQSRVLGALEDIYVGFENKIMEEGYTLDINGDRVKLLEINVLTIPEIESNCNVGEVLVRTENGAVCCKYAVWLCHIHVNYTWLRGRSCSPSVVTPVIIY